jgi:hypothetical protein
MKDHINTFLNKNNHPKEYGEKKSLHVLFSSLKIEIKDQTN